MLQGWRRRKRKRRQVLDTRWRVLFTPSYLLSRPADSTDGFAWLIYCFSSSPFFQQPICLPACLRCPLLSTFTLWCPLASCRSPTDANEQTHWPTGPSNTQFYSLSLFLFLFLFLAFLVFLSPFGRTRLPPDASFPSLLSLSLSLSLHFGFALVGQIIIHILGLFCRFVLLFVCAMAPLSLLFSPSFLPLLLISLFSFSANGSLVTEPNGNSASGPHTQSRHTTL